MDLTAFSSAVNYPIHKVFQAPTCPLKCCNSKHQHSSVNQIKQIQSTNSINQSLNGNSIQQKQISIKYDGSSATSQLDQKCKSTIQQQEANNKSLILNNTNLIMDIQNGETNIHQLDNQRFTLFNYPKNNGNFMNNQIENRSIRQEQYQDQNYLANLLPFLNNGFSNNQFNNFKSNNPIREPMLTQLNPTIANSRSKMVYPSGENSLFSCYF